MGDERDELINDITMYENMFKDDFDEIFNYFYNQNLLDGTMDDIINFTIFKKILNKKFNPYGPGNDEVIKEAKDDCAAALDKLNLIFNGDFFTSKITSRNYAISYQTKERIMAKDIFYIPPKGVPELRGPHVLGTIEYDCDFWMNYKLLLIKANREFIKSHSSEYMENLTNYCLCVEKYNLLERSDKHVKN